MKILAIDPGVNGALAYSDGQNTGVVRMPHDMAGLNHLVRHGIPLPDLVVVEDVGMSFRTDGAKQAYRFARHRGILEATLRFAFPTTPVVWVLPKVWQSVLIPAEPQTLASRVKDGKIQRDTKKLAFEFAKKKFFTFTFDLLAADALCLLAFAQTPEFLELPRRELNAAV